MDVATRVVKMWVVLSYYDEFNKVDDLYWTVQKCGSSDGDNLLDENEMFQITIGNPVNGEGGVRHQLRQRAASESPTTSCARRS